jgi:hypothetical protein
VQVASCYQRDRPALDGKDGDGAKPPDEACVTPNLTVVERLGKEVANAINEHASRKADNTVASIESGILHAFYEFSPSRFIH